MTDYGEPRRPAIDPLLFGVEEAMGAGYRTVEYVFDAFAESLRGRPRSRYERSAAASRRRAGAAGKRTGSRAAASPMETTAGSPAEPGVAGGHRSRRGRSREPVVGPGGLAELVAEFVDLFGEIVQDVAGAVGGEILGEEVPRLELHTVPGKKAKLKFRFTNTGSSALIGLGFETTPLLDGTQRIESDAISFGGVPPDTRVAPGHSVSVELEVEVQGDQQPGTYRGVIVATSTPRVGRPVAEAGLDAWALVELDVNATDSGDRMSFVAEPEES